MNLFHDWIESDVEAELQRIEEASQQLRKQRNALQANRTKGIVEYSKLNAAAKAKYDAQLKANPKSKPVLKTIPKFEHCKTTYDKTLVTPIEWIPRQIQSPLREVKHYVQIVDIPSYSKIVPGAPFQASVTDGHVSIGALFKPSKGWTSSLHLVEPGAIFQILRYSFHFPGSCSNSWEEGLTRRDQLKLARSSQERPTRPKSLKYPSIPASMSTYVWENDLFADPEILLEVELSKVLPTKASIFEDTPSVWEGGKVLGSMRRLPVHPIQLPGLDLWCTEIIEPIAQIWYTEMAWYRFSQSITPREFRKLPSIKTTFLRRLQINDRKITARAVSKARKNVFETMYRTEAPIGKLFEIWRAYIYLSDLFMDEPQDTSPRIPGTNRPLPYRNSSSSTQEGFGAGFQTQDEMMNTPQFATQFPPVHSAAGARHGREARDKLDLEKRIARFKYDLDLVECEQLSEIIRTLYTRARDGEFEPGVRTPQPEKRTGISIIRGHISDFYASKILAKVEITRVKPQTSAPRSSRAVEVQGEAKKHKKEPIQKVKQLIERPRMEVPRKEATPVATFPRAQDLSDRERLQANLTRLKKQRAIEDAQKASGSPLAAPINQPYLHSTAVPTSHRSTRENEPVPKVIKKASRKSLGAQENVKTPVAGPFTPPPIPAGDPMEGITVHTGLMHQERSNGLQSKMGRLSARRSMPALGRAGTQSSVKSTQDGFSIKRQANDRLSHLGLATDCSSQFSTPRLVTGTPVVLDSTPLSRKSFSVKPEPKNAGAAAARNTSVQNASKPTTPGAAPSTPAPVEKNTVAPSIASKGEQEQPRPVLQNPRPRKTSRAQVLEQSDAPSVASSSHSPPVVVKVESPDVGSAAIELSEEAKAPQLDTEMPEAPQPQNLLTRLEKMLQHIQNEKDQDKILPKRTRVPEDQAKALLKHSSLWPPPKRELQKHMRAVPNLEPKDSRARTCRYPEDFEPYNSTIETSTQPGTQGKQRADSSGSRDRRENPPPDDQHVFTLTNQPAEDSSDDEPVEWESTPRSQLIDPLDRENEVFENSDVESCLDDNPPPASSMQTPESRGHEATPRKGGSAVVKTNTPVSSLRRAVAEKAATPMKRITGVPLRASSPVEDEDDGFVDRYQRPSMADRVENQNSGDEVEIGEQQQAYRGDENGDENGDEGEGDKVEKEADEEEDEEYEEYYEEDEGEEEEEEQESEIQVCKTQSSPDRRHQTPHFGEPQPDIQVVDATSRVISSSQLEHHETPRSSPNITKRKADEISASPVKAGSAVSPMIRGAKVLKVEGARQVGETLIKRANAAIASSKEGVRRELNISQAGLEKGTLGNRGSLRERLNQQRDAFWNGPSDQMSDSD
ncbi:hypothetical protein TWF481_001306 [Arthrobotrys musiformis]|uniref:Uncharacterized protein n=1 Tax=Arthrobotrys musiformis TaxID=47236 RepID=A0AAV9WSG4_9PEZI